MAIGDVITLSGPNTYTGPTTISQRGEIDGVQPGSAVSSAAYSNAIDQRHRNDRDVTVNTQRQHPAGTGIRRQHRQAE